jgi:cytochrome P450
VGARSPANLRRRGPRGPAITDLLASLRAAANWAYLHPKRRADRDRFLALVDGHLTRAEPGCLAVRVASEATSAATAPASQVAYWLFAFDAAGMATFRALALLDAHPWAAERARDEIAEASAETAPELPFLRACVLESLRLWPTTPAILRDATERTGWEAGTLPAGAAVLVFAPFFHRDGERLEFADSFSPQLWLGGGAIDRWVLIPFSAGPAGCPGRDLVLLTTSSLLAGLVAGASLALSAPRALDASRPMPANLSPFRLRFDVREAQVGGSRSRVPPR